MNEAYFEIMIKKESAPYLRILTLTTLILGGGFVFLGILGIVLAFVPGILCLVAWYLLQLYKNVEYEYLYVDKELQIDRILAKSKRKRMETLDLSRLEVMAPKNSHELDRYRNSSMGKKDYTSGRSDREKSFYGLVIEGTMIYLEPTAELVKSIQMIAPRKVFTY